MSFDGAGMVLQNVSLSIKKGNILGIIGQSGSGKTTLIKILAGLLEPDKGQVSFKGKKMEGPNEKLVPGHEEIRLVHQDFKLHHRMTVKENITNALIAYIPEYKKERTTELLELCGITSIAHQYVDKISGGEKQRVAIGMALATEPEVLLFDEPFSNLDFLTKGHLLQEIDHIAKVTSTSIILITHDSRDAMEVADYMMVLDQGKIIREGTPQQIYRQPAYKNVANLLGLHTVLMADNLRVLSGNFPKNGFYGIWAEDVLLHKPDGHQGRIKKVIFSGPVNKLLIAAKGFEIWAYDYSGKIKERDKVRFSVKNEMIFPLK